jgi:hypothetical protein
MWHLTVSRLAVLAYCKISLTRCKPNFVFFAGKGVILVNLMFN